ncbi:MAG: transposase family protein, partial [Armatimonadota bacterium]
TVIAVNERRRIRAVTHSAPGSYHDLRVTVESGILEDIPEDLPVLCDAGFDGLKKYFPERDIFTPHKARRNRSLLPEEKLANRKFSSVRILVEHTFCRLKSFNILSFPFRHNLSLYDRVFLAVVGIVNFQIDWRSKVIGVA